MKANLSCFAPITGREFDLSRLRIMLSTGSVLSAELYEWFYATAFPPSALLISMSGGTDIVGCCKKAPDPEVVSHIG